MDYLDRIATKMNQAYGLEAYYEITKNGSMFKPSVIMKKFSDNSFWARDAATRCVAEKIDTKEKLAEMVQEAFASDGYTRLAYDADMWMGHDEKTQKLQKELSDKYRFNFAHSVSKMAGLAAMKLNIERFGAEGVDVLRYHWDGGRNNRVLVWNPEDPSTAMLNTSGRIKQLSGEWYKGYNETRYILQEKNALV